MSDEEFKKLINDEMIFMEDSIKAGADQKEIAFHILDTRKKIGKENPAFMLEYLYRIAKFIELCYACYGKPTSVKEGVKDDKIS